MHMYVPHHPPEGASMASEPETTQEPLGPADGTQHPDDAREKVNELEDTHISTPAPGRVQTLPMLWSPA